ncbi:MAG: LacI family DNA-binding transcriptional regulator [Spirochaetales bacterium]|nr:LacI family DNA-binding transcriptional regulator [Spirochaetales bacterium]
MTIKDIARLAGVTHSTVSRSLNDSPLVATATKERIKKIAQDTGYSPNSFARRLVTRRSNTLGVFFLSRGELNFMENFGTEFLDGIATASSSNGYDLLFFTMTRELSQKKSYIGLCREKHVEGVIFIGMTSDDPQLEEIASSDIPVCIIDFQLEGVGFVSTDNEKGTRLALDYLWSKGHRKIAYIGGPTVAPVAMIRERCYQNYMVEKGLGPFLEIFRGDFTTKSGYAQTLDLLRSEKLPSAIMAANDYMALGSVKALKEKGLRVPQDMSVVGYDNVLAGEYADPGLTTVGQDSTEIGLSAVRYLFDKIQNKKPPLTRLINPCLVLRDSVSSVHNKDVP